MRSELEDLTLKQVFEKFIDFTVINGEYYDVVEALTTKFNAETATALDELKESYDAESAIILETFKSSKTADVNEFKTDLNDKQTAFEKAHQKIVNHNILEFALALLSHQETLRGLEAGENFAQDLDYANNKIKNIVSPFFK